MEWNTINGNLMQNGMRLLWDNVRSKDWFGFLGLYNSGIGYGPFERFEVGGDGISNIQLYGKEIVALKDMNGRILSSDAGAPFFDKFTLELRYPLSLNPMSTIYTLAFLEEECVD